MPKVSVIVPVYNTEKYLPLCIESILAQTFIDFELILVNDGSIDNSGKICDEYAKKDSRIVVIHKKNGGANEARKTGVIHAKGYWITFVDSDDTINKDALNLLYSHVSGVNDIIIGQIDQISINDTKQLSALEYRERLISSMLAPGPVAKLYNKALFSDTTFDISPKIIVGEDMLMNIRLAFNTEKDILFIPNIIYHYNIHNNSTFSKFKTNVSYEDLFFKEFILSIPQTKPFDRLIFKHSYLKWNDLCGNFFHYDDLWDSTEMKKYLMKNISRYKSDVKLLDYISIKYDNKYCHICCVLIKKLINLVCRKSL